jgi:hypothetical protein
MAEPESVDTLDQLMREYQRGSVAAFESLYRALAPPLSGFIRARVRRLQIPGSLDARGS